MNIIKEILILGFKNCRNSIFFLSLLFLCSSCFILKPKKVTEKEPLLEIHFQDYFENDRISLKFNECSIFDNLVLNSNVVGLTKIQIKVFKKQRNYYWEFLDKTVGCKLKNDNIGLSIVMNDGNPMKYLIDLNKGKYIGFSKKDSNNLSMVQSLIPFVYL